MEDEREKEGYGIKVGLGEEKIRNIRDEVEVSYKFLKQKKKERREMFEDMKEGVVKMKIIKKEKYNGLGEQF